MAADLQAAAVLCGQASPGRNWNDATALLITGKGGVQIMGDWAKGEFTAARQVAGKDYGCMPALVRSRPTSSRAMCFVFPKTSDPQAIQQQKVLATVMMAPATQVAFSQIKGSIPVRPDVDASRMDVCAQMGIAVMKDKTRQLGNGEVYLTPDQNGALQDVITAFWNRNIAVEKVQRDIVSALKN